MQKKAFENEKKLLLVGEQLKQREAEVKNLDKKKKNLLLKNSAEKEKLINLEPI